MTDLTSMTVTVPDDFIGTPTTTNGMLYVYAGGDHWEQFVKNCTITMDNPWGGCIKKESDNKSWDGLEELL